MRRVLAILTLLLLSATLLLAAQDTTAEVGASHASPPLSADRGTEAAARDLADARDEEILATTLYTSVSAEDIHQSAFVRDLVEKQADAMTAASMRRIERQQTRISNAQSLVRAGRLPHSALPELFAEMEKRTAKAHLAVERASALRLVTDSARASERAQARQGRGRSMEKYLGNGLFTAADQRLVSGAFARKFGRALPVSAHGDTQLHRALGLDHSGRIDVAVTPDSAEGAWLRRYLENLRIPYYAFRRAVAGSATAAHIHIGPGSTRIAFRSASVSTPRPSSP